MYNGGVRKLRLSRVVIDKSKGVTQCSQCQGRGVVLRTMQMGPMIQRVQSPCPNGSCDKGTVCVKKNTKETLEVHIPRGAKDGQKVTFYEMGDEIPDGNAGDVLIVLDIQDHKDFLRKGCDLYLKRKISLVEALCGFSMDIEHLVRRKTLRSPCEPSNNLVRVADFSRLIAESRVFLCRTAGSC